VNASPRHHPTDERLIALYFGDEEASAEERKAVRQHLHGCEACTWRYTELTAPLERLRQDAASEADEVFTPARLEAQRAAIHRRLEEGQKAARVVAFPAARPAVRPGSHRPLVRWVAAAAAAGLIVGVSAGRFLDLRDTRQRPAAPVASAPSSARPAPPVPVGPVVVDVANDDADFLWEIDFAVRRLHSTELGALDALTPHPRDAVMAMR
jgi:anti-sigma factor RsiW